jgi:DNA polymerase III delta prime subunit
MTSPCESFDLDNISLAQRDQISRWLGTIPPVGTDNITWAWICKGIQRINLQDYMNGMLYLSLAIFGLCNKDDKTDENKTRLINSLKNRFIEARENYISQLKQSTGEKEEATVFEPTSANDMKDPVSNEQISFESVKGSEREKLDLKFKFLYPNLYPDLYMKEENNVLLYGPPGTGKTLLAKACVAEFEKLSNGRLIVKFFNVTADKLRSKWEGGTEQNIRDVFLAASNEAKKNTDPRTNTVGKSILFFDEVEAIAASRTEGGGSSERSVTTLLQQMQGFKSNPGVMILAATNRPWSLDSAFLRRFTGVIFVDIGDFEARVSLIEGDFIKRYSKIHIPFLKNKLCDISIDSTCPTNINKEWCKLYEDYQTNCNQDFISVNDFFKEPGPLKMWKMGIDLSKFGDNPNDLPPNDRPYDESLDQKSSRLWQYCSVFRSRIIPQYEEVINEYLDTLPIENGYKRQGFVLYRESTDGINKPIGIYTNAYFTYQGLLLIKNTKSVTYVINESNSDGFRRAINDPDDIIKPYKDLEIMFNFVAELTGPSLDAYGYGYIRDYKRTFPNALSSFGYSGSDLSNVISEFFSVMASTILSETYEDMDCKDITKCEFKNENVMEKRCFKTSKGKREFKDTRDFSQESGKNINYSYMIQIQDKLYDLYSRIKILDWFKALVIFKTTTGNLDEYCSFVAYEESGRSVYRNLAPVCPIGRKSSSFEEETTIL